MEHEKWSWQEPGTAWKGAGIYHVTITIPSREPLLGTLVIPNNDPMQARVERTELGNALVEKLLSHPTYYPEVRVLQFCLMPDHLHAILYVTRPMKESIRIVVRSFWQGAKKLGRAYSYSVASESNSGIEIRNLIPDQYEKEDPIFTEKPFIRPLSRYDQLPIMYNYIQMNPQRLATKRIKPGYFCVQEGIEIGGRVYRGVGNAMLLQEARYVPVHVRWTMMDEAAHGDPQRLREYMNGCVVEARKGAVMVSPFISAYEKQVMAVLLKEKRPFILLADNGFRDYYKPAEGLFNAVAEGLVLILSPWEYDPQKRKVSRDECKQMNKMAEEICNVPE